MKSGFLGVMKYGFFDLTRNRVTIVHTVFFALVTLGFLNFSEDYGQSLAGVVNLAILIIPVVGMVFGTVHFYNSREYIELLLSLPINRRSVFLGHYFGLAFPLALAFVLGTSVPFLGYWLLGKIALDSTLLLYLMSGFLLTFISTAIAYFLGVRFENRLRGLGFVVAVWLGFSFVYDAIILFLTMTFRDYPLEWPLILLSLLNPIDLARVLVLLRLDIAALLGYTGAVFQKFFGTAAGLALAVASMLVWSAFPLLAALRLFKRKDF